MELKTYLEFFEHDRENRRQYRKSGIYAFLLLGEVVYVGQSTNLHLRFFHHAENFAKVRPKKIPSNKKYILLKPYIDKVEWKVLEYCSKEDLDERENSWIDFYNPIFNIQRRDGKVYFTGDSQDIDNYVSGEVDMKYLRTKLSNY